MDGPLNFSKAHMLFNSTIIHFKTNCLPQNADYFLEKTKEFHEIVICLFFQAIYIDRYDRGYFVSKVREEKQRKVMKEMISETITVRHYFLRLQ